MLRQTAEAGGDVKLWHGGLSLLRRHVLPGLTNGEMRQQAENLWQQARASIGEMVERVQGNRQLQTRQQAEALRRIGMELITTFDVTNVMDILTRSLPSIGIPGCSLALYEDPEHPLEDVRVMLAGPPQERLH